MIGSLLKPLMLAGQCVLLVPGQPTPVRIHNVPAPLTASVHTSTDADSGCTDIYLDLALPHDVVLTTRMGEVGEAGQPVCWGFGIALLCGVHLDAQGRVSAVIVNFN